MAGSCIITDNKITILNYADYNAEIEDGSLILTRKELYLSIEDLFMKDLRYSVPQSVIINNVAFNCPRLSYIKILMNCISQIDRDIFMTQTKLNIRTDPCYENGFKYFDTMRLSIQGADCYKTLREIIKFAITLDLKIKLRDGQICRFKK
jgi:hypothetical protein